MQIVNHLLRILHRRRLAARKQLARPLHQLLLPAADHRRMNPKLRDSSARVFSPQSAAIATRALNSALCCFLFMPTSHILLDRSAFSLSRCPKIRSRRNLRVGRIFSGRYTGQFLAAVRYPDWERLGRTMHAAVSEAEFQKAIAEADRICELQSRSIVIDIDIG